MPRLRKDSYPVLTVDAIVRKNSDEILIEQRGVEPYKGSLAFPGGHVEYGETVEHAVLRELWEECSVVATLRSILGVYSDPTRDPRGQRVSVVFIADYKRGTVKAGDDARSVFWMKIQDLRRRRSLLAFDHKLIFRDYLTWRNSVKNENWDYTFWSSKKR
jgi:8-oxo-dGTP diphosphatase